MKALDESESTQKALNEPSTLM
ncbi:hypothetical protein VCHENC02_3554, partial [Vibrio harveyi]